MKYILICLLALMLQLDGREMKINYESWSKQQVDIVVFSFDRPMQLYAFLESVEAYVTNPHLIHVIYRCTDKRFEKGYDIVFERFPYVQGHIQGKNPQKDFKQLCLKSIYTRKSKSPYIMFAVDDIVMTDKVDLVECTKALKKYNSWFFSLRLGKNISHNPLSIATSLEPVFVGVPAGKELRNNMFSWKFTDPTAKGSWNYPNSTDVTIYRKKALKRFFKKASYTNPNTLEAEWHWNWQPRNKKGLCYQHSKAVNIPLNVVNPYWQSANVNISTWQLLEKFVNGEKIDITKLHKLEHNATHIPFEPTFVPIDQKISHKKLPKNSVALPPPPVEEPPQTNPTTQWIQDQLKTLG